MIPHTLSRKYSLCNRTFTNASILRKSNPEQFLEIWSCQNIIIIIIIIIQFKVKIFRDVSREFRIKNTSYVACFYALVTYKEPVTSSNLMDHHEDKHIS